MELNQLPISQLIEFARNNLAIAIPMLLVVLAAVILYYVAM